MANAIVLLSWLRAVIGTIRSIMAINWSIYAGLDGGRSSLLSGFDLSCCFILARSEINLSRSGSSSTFMDLSALKSEASARGLESNGNGFGALDVELDGADVVAPNVDNGLIAGRRDLGWV